ncbi:MAG: nucleoside diphosphate kinase regulator [Pararhodobacter sp.]|nr:nucleoside diphosphate kinase regulator [Pararhodobacter sp.]
MADELTSDSKSRGDHHREILINADHQARIEALAEAAMERNPALAARLIDEISRARIVTPEQFPPTVVDIGSRVTYKNETTGLKRAVVLVFPEDTDLTRQHISVVTPLGVALLDLKKGQEFLWDAHANPRWLLTVTDVEPPEREHGGKGQH